jgi:hypothetical protein
MKFSLAVKWTFEIYLLWFLVCDYAFNEFVFVFIYFVVVEVAGQKGKDLYNPQFPTFLSRHTTAIQVNPKETYFTKISKHSCNEIWWVYIKQIKQMYKQQTSMEYSIQ